MLRIESQRIQLALLDLARSTNQLFEIIVDFNVASRKEVVPAARQLRAQSSRTLRPDEHGLRDLQPVRLKEPGSDGSRMHREDTDSVRL